MNLPTPCETLRELGPDGQGFTWSVWGPVVAVRGTREDSEAAAILAQRLDPHPGAVATEADAADGFAGCAGVLGRGLGGVVRAADWSADSPSSKRSATVIRRPPNCVPNSSIR